MGNDISTNQPSLVPPPKIKNIQELIHAKSINENLIFDFNDNDKTAMVIGNNNLSTKIFIPHSIKHNDQDYIIIGIAEGSFQNSNIQSVKFPSDSEVRIIGKKAFSGTKIGSIDIPPHVTEIGEWAFSECRNLWWISFNFELKTIGRGAFHLTNLMTIFIEESVTELADGWNNNMKMLEKICVVKGNKNFKISDDKIFIFGKSDPSSDEYDTIVFSNRSITNVTIPPFIKKIGSSAFAYSKLKSITIPKQVIEISERSFYSCGELQTVDFEENSELQIIGEFAFCDSSIKEIMIPKRVNKISSGAFYQCSSLQQINIPDDSELQVIEEIAFEYSLIKSINIPSSLTKLKDNWLKSSVCKNFEVHIDVKNKVFKYFEDKIIIGKSNPESDDYDDLIFVRKDITKLTIPAFVKRITPYSFCNCKNLDSIEFEENSKLQIIESRAFFLCSIESLTIPASVVSIKEGAFEYADKLVEVNVDINNSQYKKQDGLIIGKTDPKNDDYDVLIFANKNIEKAEIPSTIKRIWPNAFRNTNLTSITIPKSVVEIGDSSFQYCHKLEEVKFEDDSELKIIGKSAFFSSSIKTFVIPPNVTQISDEAFSISQLKQIVFSENSKLRSIGDSAFSYTYIKNIIIPPNATEISSSAFSECKALKGIVFENKKMNLKSLKFKKCNAILLLKNEESINGHPIFDFNLLYRTAKFKGCVFEVDSILIPKSVKRGLLEYTVTEISEKAFENSETIQTAQFPDDSLLQIIGSSSFASSTIQNITIPASVIEICPFAFNDCSKLSKVTFGANSNLRIIGKASFSNLKIKSIKIPENVIEIHEDAFLNCYKLCDFEFEGIPKLKIIGANFINNTFLSNLTVPASVVELKDGWSNNLFGTKVDVSEGNQIYKVFEDNFIIGKSDPKSDDYDKIVYAYNNLKKIEIPLFIKKISGFSRIEIKSITIPDHVTEIGSYSFKSCDSLKHIMFSEKSQLRIIGSNAFESCNFESITIPPHVIEIQKQAFQHSKLKQLKFSDNSKLKIIHDEAFSYCSINVVQIPSSVIEIGEGAFQNCNLVNVVFSENSNLQIIRIDAFRNNPLEFFIIPQSVTQFDESLVSFCDNLSYIFINSNLSSSNTIDIPEKAQIISHSNLYKSEDDEYYLSFDFNDDEKTAKIKGLNIKKDFVAVPRSVNHNGNEYIVTEICNGAFKNSEIKIIYFPSDSEVQIIGENSFAESPIHNIVIPSSVTQICDNAFQSCQLKNVIFAQNSKITSIGKNAFANTLVEEIQIPPSAKQISTDAFSDCSSLKNIFFDENSEFKPQQFGVYPESKPESQKNTETKSTSQDDKEGKTTFKDDNERKETSQDDNEGKATIKDDNERKATSQNDKEEESTSQDDNEEESTSQDDNEEESTSQDDNEEESTSE